MTLLLLLACAEPSPPAPFTCADGTSPTSTSGGPPGHVYADQTKWACVDAAGVADGRWERNHG
ncbi:MAG: hypothetical protein ACK4YP_13545, partial [Myxococcota bacterium]